MRELLAVISHTTESTNTAAAAVVLAIVSAIIVVPAILLCGDCFGDSDDKKPIQPHPQVARPDPRLQAGAQHGAYMTGPPYGVQHPAPHGHPYAGYPHAPPYQQGYPQYPQHAYPQQQYDPRLHPQHPQHHDPRIQQAHAQAQVVPSHHQQPPEGQAPAPPGAPVSRTSNASQPNIPEGAVLEPRDTSLEAVEEVLHSMCTSMNGSVRPGKTLIKATIRRGINAVIADASTNYAVDETILFFPDRNCKMRQMRLYEQLNLKDSMPLVSLDTDVFTHTDHNRSAMLPACIFVNRAKTLDTVVQNFATPQEKQQELFGIWQQLAKLLRMFHQRGWFLRDVTYDNVVFVRMGVSEGWTLLEFGNASKEKKGIDKQTIPPRAVPPELAQQMLIATAEKVHLSPAYDMWQLGILVYEVMTGQPYWRTNMSDADVLRAMADPSKPLPHMERPMGLDLLQKVMVKLMHRDPVQRFTSSELIKRLEQDLATAGAITMNPGEAVEEPDLIIES